MRFVPAMTTAEMPKVPRVPQDAERASRTVRAQQVRHVPTSYGRGAAALASRSLMAAPRPRLGGRTAISVCRPR